MIQPSLQLGGGNWANKSDSLLGYHKDGANFYADELTFSRNSLGSYTDANGLVQTMPYNLFPYSNNFNNWASSTRVFKNSGQSGYDGTNNAWLIVPTNDNNSHVIGQSLDSGVGVRTISVYAKSGGYNYFSIRDDSSGSSYAKFDLNLGLTEISGTNAISSSIVFVNDGWYRCSLTYTETAIGNIVFYINNSYVNIASFVGDEVSGVYIQDAQLNQGSTAKPYFATTTRLNLARVDYKDNANGSLLLEPQRTNRITNSEDGSTWALSNITLSSLSGGLNKEYYEITSLGNTGRFDVVNNAWVNLTAGTYTASVFAKKGTSDEIILTTRASFAAASAFSVFNLTSGTVLSNSGVVGSIEAYSDGWYRCAITFTNSGSYTDYASFAFGFNFNSSSTDTLFVTAPQSELGSYSTSYIPTNGTAVTRLQDSCSMTGISDKIGQTEGTLFAEIDYTLNTDSAGILGIDAGGTTFAYIFVGASNSIYFNIYNAGSPHAALSFTVPSSGKYKIAGAYKANDFVLYVNGVQRATDTSGTVPACSILSIDSTAYGLPANSKHSQIAVFKTRLSNAELATLTTL